MEWTVVFFLVYCFIAFYFFFLFSLIFFKNRNNIYKVEKPIRNYSVSIIIPAYNEESTIAGTIEAILNLDYSDLKKIIVVNDGSTDNTKKEVQKIMKKDKRILLINKENSGKADSINQALKIVESELFAVCDADSFPEKDSLKNLVGYFNDPEVGGATSFVKVRNREKFLGTVQAMEYAMLGFMRKLLDFVDSVYVTPGPLSIYRTQLVIRLGGFDNSTVTEDIEIAWRIINSGYKIRMGLTSVATTIAPSKLKMWWNQRTRWGVGGLQTMMKYKKSFFKKGMFGWFIMPFVLSTIFLSIFSFLFGAYLLLKTVLRLYFTSEYSILANIPIIDLSASPTPSFVFFMLLFLFAVGFSWGTLGWYIANEKEFIRLTGKRLFNRAIYMFIYLPLYPLIWFNSIYQIITGRTKWGTK